jgi:hypothetical protein
MRLKCTHGMFAHWGTIFEEGKEYDVIGIVERKVAFITDYKKYFEKISLLARSRDWIREGYTQEEFYKMGAAVSEARNDNLRGKPAFEFSVSVIDENFDYVQTRRDRRLSEIGSK